MDEISSYLTIQARNLGAFLFSYAVRNYDILNGDWLREGQKGHCRSPWRTFRDVDLVSGDPLGALHLRINLFDGDGVAGAARGQVLVHSVRRAVVAVHQPRVADVHRPALWWPGRLHAMHS